MPDLHTLTATEMRAALDSGQTSARALVTSALKRIDHLNPHLNAIVQRCDDQALCAADAVDQALAKGTRSRPPRRNTRYRKGQY